MSHYETKSNTQTEKSNSAHAHVCTAFIGRPTQLVQLGRSVIVIVIAAHRQ